MLRSPKFWFDKSRTSVFIARILFPVSLIWKFFSERRILKGKNEKFAVPIICVGNINIGGSGKTPTSIALAHLFLEKNINVHIISKGYKGKHKGPKKVSEGDDSYTVGDEPVLMSNFAPVWVARKRRNSIIAAIEDGAELLILDDGFQDSSIRKNLSIVTVDAKLAFGNQKVIPAGPLREAKAKGLDRADILLVIGDKAHRESFMEDIETPKGLAVFFGEMSVLKTGIDLNRGKFVAVAGIGHPEKFFDTIEKCGGHIVKRVALPDHADFSYSLLQRLKRMGSQSNAQLITTEKDSVRIPESERQNFISLPVRLNLLNKKSLMNLIQFKIGQSFK